MSKELVAAIDDLLKFIRLHVVSYGEILDDLNALDRTVFVEAHRCGFQDHLPRKDATFIEPTLVFFGRTNIPGAWSSPPDSASTLVLMDTQGWLADMFSLRALAEAKIVRDRSGDEQTVETVEEETPQYVTRNQIAALIGYTKDRVADWFNDDDKSPKPVIEGGGGKAIKYLWREVRPWLESTHGIRELPLKFPSFNPV